MKTLFIVNDAPYGSEKMFNALRLAMALQKDSLASGIWFLLMDAARVSALARKASASTTPPTRANPHGLWLYGPRMLRCSAGDVNTILSLDRSLRVRFAAARGLCCWRWLGPASRSRERAAHRRWLDIGAAGGGAV